MPPENTSLELLRQIESGEGTSQRDLASKMGVSVGKVNYCLRALVDKGWIKAKNFRRADNKWAYIYLLTPSGANAKLQLTRDFLSRKEREFEALQSEIRMLRHEIASDAETDSCFIQDSK
jgi:MarR family transcriptional regulator, temperature-dependent positive regulator of motility